MKNVIELKQPNGNVYVRESEAGTFHVFVEVDGPHGCEEYLYKIHATLTSAMRNVSKIIKLNCETNFYDD